MIGNELKLYCTCLQGLNTLKYVMDTDDDVFDVEGGESTPILSLVSRPPCTLSKKIINNC